MKTLPKFRTWYIIICQATKLVNKCIVFVCSASVSESSLPRFGVKTSHEEELGKTTWPYQTWKFTWRKLTNFSEASSIFPKLFFGLPYTYVNFFCWEPPMFQKEFKIPWKNRIDAYAIICKTCKDNNRFVKLVRSGNIYSGFSIIINKQSISFHRTLSPYLLPSLGDSYIRKVGGSRNHQVLGPIPTIQGSTGFGRVRQGSAGFGTLKNSPYDSDVILCLSNELLFFCEHFFSSSH